MRLRRPSLPITEDTLSVFVASLAKEGVSLKVYLAAIRHYQFQNGQGHPGISRMVCLEYIMKGIKCVLKPFFSLLKTLIELYDNEHFDHLST